jgi:hypothetical protein
MTARTVLAALMLAATSVPAAAQDLAQRVAAVGNGTVRISYGIRPHVEICDQGIRMGSDRVWWRSEGGEDTATGCRTGPAEAELDVRNGQVTDVDLVRRERDRTSGAVDLGDVRSGAAADYLLDLARAGVGGKGGGEAIFAAVLADVEDLWRDLMEIARDQDVRPAVRKNALFWVGQEAAAAATDGLAEVAFDEDEEQDVRDAAVFALSQRPESEGLPVLMELARTARHANTRRSAMFWLAQSEDDRVLAFFEEVLSGGGGA